MFENVQKKATSRFSDDMTWTSMRKEKAWQPQLSTEKHALQGHVMVIHMVCMDRHPPRQAAGTVQRPLDTCRQQARRISSIF